MGFEELNSNYRDLVIGVNTSIPLVDGAYITAVNLDNAATTPAFCAVQKEVDDFLPWYSSIHRGKGYKSMYSTKVYEEGRDIIKSFVKADADKDTVIYTKNTTDAINLLSYVLSQQKKGQEYILSTWMEHAANDLPWRENFRVDYVETDSFGRLDMNDLQRKLKKYAGRVKLVTVAAASNVTGYINPIYEIAKLAHENGAKILVDGAQLVPHAPCDMKPFGDICHIDFLAFSAHKMYAPYGAGVLIGPKSMFTTGLPYAQGGSAIKLVTHNRIEWEEPPAKDEAGTPNLLGVIALIAAIKELTRLGMKDVFRQEKILHEYAMSKLKDIPDIMFYNSPDMNETIGVIPFNIDGVSHQLMSTVLSYEAGIAVRNGFFCSHPYCERLLGLTDADMKYYFDHPEVRLPGIVRASFGLYNNFAEIDRLAYALRIITENKNFYIDKYLGTRSQYVIPNEV